MNNRNLRFFALVFAALTVGMKLAHTLELPVKLEWTADLYFPVQTSLYRYFAIFGPIVDVGALLAIGVLVFRLRGKTAFPLTAIGLGAMLVSLAIWAVIVAPANAQIMPWLTAHTVPGDWMVWRARWQFGQAGCFIFDFTGFCCVLLAALRDSPRDSPRD